MLTEKEFIKKAKELYYLMIQVEDKKTIDRNSFIRSCSKMSNYDNIEYPRIINYLLDNYIMNDDSFVPFIMIYDDLKTNVNKQAISRLLSYVFYNVKKGQKLIANTQYKGFHLKRIINK